VVGHKDVIEQVMKRKKTIWSRLKMKTKGLKFRVKRRG
jgi:hypothetical protein